MINTHGVLVKKKEEIWSGEKPDSWKLQDEFFARSRAGLVLKGRTWARRRATGLSSSDVCKQII